MKKAIALSLAACTALLAGNAALAGADVGSWYIAPQVQGVWLDDTRVADDDIGFQVSLGRVMSPNWNAELSYNTSNHSRAPARS